MVKYFHLAPVTCKNCGKIFDYGKQPEVAMGAVKCPHCGAIVDQTGKDVLFLT